MVVRSWSRYNLPTYLLCLSADRGFSQPLPISKPLLSIWKHNSTCCHRYFRELTSILRFSTGFLWHELCSSPRGPAGNLVCYTWITRGNKTIIDDLVIKARQSLVEGQIDLWNEVRICHHECHWQRVMWTAEGKSVSLNSVLENARRRYHH